MERTYESKHLYLWQEKVLTAAAWTGSRHVYDLSTTKPISHLYAVP